MSGGRLRLHFYLGVWSSLDWTGGYFGELWPDILQSSGYGLFSGGGGETC